MFRLSIKFILIIFLFQYSTACFSQKKIQQIDNTITEFLKYGSIPGASIAITKNDKLVYVKGYGYSDINRTKKINPENLFRIASVSKPITAVAIMNLVSEKKLKLTDRVFGLEGILDYDEYKKINDYRLFSITIQNLLEHSAGWDRDISGDPMFKNISEVKKSSFSSSPKINGIIKYVIHQRLDFTPGKKYAYSNFGYCILGRVIEKLSGDSYENYVKKNILSKCGITKMQIGSTNKVANNEVHYYDDPIELSKNLTINLEEKKCNPYNCFDLETLDSDGGWIASPTDILKFVVRVNGFNYKKDILPLSIIKKMGRPSKNNPYYSLGWSVNSIKNRWHHGSLQGASSVTISTNNGFGWCILLNKRNLNPKYIYELGQVFWRAIDNVQFENIDLFETH